MKIEIKKRDDCARFGNVKIDGKSFEIPNIIYVHTDRFRYPDFADMVGILSGDVEGKIEIKYPEFRWINSRSKNNSLSVPDGIIYPSSLPGDFHLSFGNEKWGIIQCNEEGKINVEMGKKIYSLANISNIYPKSRCFLENVVRVREKIGCNALLHAPSVSDVKNLSLLVYIGIDILDSVKAVVCARKGILFFPEGNLKKDDLKTKICSCDACREFDSHQDMNFEAILKHNIISLRKEMDKIKFFLSEGRLRELVETRIANSSDLIEKFRLIHREYYDFMEERVPLIKKNILKANLRESLDYPEVQRFRYRILERYEKPEITSILLLLPCSAKKPYSTSKSHRLFRIVLKSCKNPYIVHEVIVTSPLGLVPRELELVYPARNYDIPVTGHWFSDELEMIKNMLENFFEKNKYDLVISHLPDPINSIVTEVHEDVISTCLDKPTSKKSLQKLREILVEYTGESRGSITKRTRLLSDLKSIARYQFGKRVANDLIKFDDNVKGDYPNIRVFRRDKQICSLSGKRGFLSLTLEGADILFKHKTNVVETESCENIRGSLLAPYVIGADERIRIEDEVVIIRENEIVASGISKMNGREMVELNYGEAVRIRHHI